MTHRNDYFTFGLIHPDYPCVIKPVNLAEDEKHPCFCKAAKEPGWVSITCRDFPNRKYFGYNRQDAIRHMSYFLWTDLVVFSGKEHYEYPIPSELVEGEELCDLTYDGHCSIWEGDGEPPSTIVIGERTYQLK